MPGFNCGNCGSDLSLRMDLLAIAIQADYPEGDYPRDLSVDGACEKCGHPFNYSGTMFTHWLKSKAEEGVIDPETDRHAIVSFEVSNEEVKEFQRLTELGDKKKLRTFVRRMMMKKEEEE